jgi:hypothetical protein
MGGVNPRPLSSANIVVMKMIRIDICFNILIFYLKSTG